MLGMCREVSDVTHYAAIMPSQREGKAMRRMRQKTLAYIVVICCLLTLHPNTVTLKGVTQTTTARCHHT